MNWHAFRPLRCTDMTRLIASLLLLSSLAACASRTAAPVTTVADSAAKTTLNSFSGNEPGGLPPGWEPMIILPNKNRTQYQLIRKDQSTVLHARAEKASSGLMHRMQIDPQTQPWLQWQWKVESLLRGADNTKRATEDSPVRIVLGFDGDKDSLPFSDQIMFDTAKMLTGHEFPYATLMYIWENKAPVGTVIPSTHSGRIKMVVAEQGESGVGAWRRFTRNIVEDFERAYGEKPGKLIGIGVLTDTDNTGETVNAWYGDIRLLPQYAAQEEDFSLSLSKSQ